MSAPKNNKNALGNKGGGRKSHAQEKANYKRLADMFFISQEKDKLHMKIKKGCYSIEDKMLLSALEGKEKSIIAVFNKLYPKLSIGRLDIESNISDEDIDKMLDERRIKYPSS